MTIKRLVLNQETYANATKDINKQIKECVNEIESAELKINAENGLRFFANKILHDALISLGVYESQIVMAVGMMQRGQPMPKVVVSLNPPFTPYKELKKTIPDKPLNFTGGKPPRYGVGIDLGKDVPVINVGELGVPNNEWGKIYMARVKETFYKLAEEDAKFDSHISLRNIAEMTVRYEGTLKRLDDLRARGVNLITTSRHENCSKRCEKWQGGHYTLDNTYQVVDGIQFIPLSVATDQYITTKSGKTYKNGHLTGYNCRHYPMEYKKGVEPPMVDKATVERQRKIDKRMRELERLIRRWKEQVAMLEGTPFTKELKNAKLKVRYWKNQYELFCKENRRAIETSRIQIF